MAPVSHYVQNVHSCRRMIPLEPGATSAKAKGNVDTRALAKETTSECTGEKSCAPLVTHNCVTGASQKRERTEFGKSFFVFSFVSYYILTCVDAPGVSSPPRKKPSNWHSNRDTTVNA